MNVDSEHAEVLAGRCIIVSIIISAVASIFLWGDWVLLSLLWVVGMPLMTLLFGYLTGFFLVMLGATQDNQLWFDDASALVVERSEKILGTFNGSPIHEYVVLKRPDTDELVKCLYDRTIDLQAEEIELPSQQWFVLENGILYIADHEPETILIPPRPAI